jgi:hypothetical protein
MKKRCIICHIELMPDELEEDFCLKHSKMEIYCPVCRMQVEYNGEYEGHAFVD